MLRHDFNYVSGWGGTAPPHPPPLSYGPVLTLQFLQIARCARRPNSTNSGTDSTSYSKRTLEFRVVKPECKLWLKTLGTNILCTFHLQYAKPFVLCPCFHCKMYKVLLFPQNPWEALISIPRIRSSFALNFLPARGLNLSTGLHIKNWKLFLS